MHWQFFVSLMKYKFTNVCSNLNLKCFPTGVILTFVRLLPGSPGRRMWSVCRLLSTLQTPQRSWSPPSQLQPEVASLEMNHFIDRLLLLLLLLMF